ncbi:MAG: 4Fe-4S dicluster domain-containing protein [Bacteroidales bacterium]
MTTAYLISPDELRPLVERLRTTREVWGPQRVAGSDQLFFDRLVDVDRLRLGDWLPAMPPKEVFLPQLERILSYRYDRERMEASVAPRFEPTAKALVGLRPCDLAGLQCLDRFFLGQEFVDEVYLAHRKQTFIVVETCIQPGQECFCVCTDTGPAAQEGYDLSLTRIGEDEYLVETGSEDGQAMAVASGWRGAEPGAVERKAKAVDDCISRFPEQAPRNKAWISRAMNRVTTGFIKPETWEYVGKQCFECGACSFVCPSCSCFNIEDVACGTGDCDRLRTRDSCSFEGYTRMAGDHNPRKPVEDRRNKRFFCKFSYAQSKKHLRPGCVGCGRCAWVCPGDIGMPNVVKYIHRETTDRQG